MTDPHRAARPHLTISQGVIDGVRVLTLRGDIDHDVKDVFSKALLSFDSAAPPRTVVDLSGITFMDSAGINVFLTAHQAMTDAQGWLRIAGAQPSVLRLLELVGLDQVIGCHPTVEQALTA